MKQKLFLLAIVIPVSSFTLLLIKKDLKSSCFPFAYLIYSIDGPTGKITNKLESASALYLKPKGKETAATYSISGSKSSVRLKITEAVFQSNSELSTGTLNPVNYISLYKLNVSKSSRTFTMNTDGSSPTLIPILFISLDQLSHRIGVTGTVLPGEYAFTDRTTTDNVGNVIVWTFGID